jgi:hypothetical protein
MNKRVAKPKDDELLPPDSDVTEAQMEQYFRDNHAAIEAKLLEARDAIARGEVSVMPPLPELLKRLHRLHKSKA